MNGYRRNTMFGRDSHFEEVRDATDIACTVKEMRTDKTHCRDADINEIWRRVGLGQMQLKSIAVPFMEVTEMFDFQKAQQLLIDGKQAFMRLPSDVRDRFGNEPSKFMDFCMKGKGDAHVAEEMVRMGLAVKIAKVEEVGA